MVLAVSPRQISTNDFIAQGVGTTPQTRAVTLGDYLGPELDAARLHPLERPDGYGGGAQLLWADQKLLLGVANRQRDVGYRFHHARYYKVGDGQSVGPRLTSDGDPQKRRLVFEADVGEGVEEVSVPNDPAAVHRIEDSLNPEIPVFLPLGDVDALLTSRLHEVGQGHTEFTPWLGTLASPPSLPLDFGALLSSLRAYTRTDLDKAIEGHCASFMITLGAIILRRFGTGGPSSEGYTRPNYLKSSARGLISSMTLSSSRTSEWFLRFGSQIEDPRVLFALRAVLEAVAEAGDPFGYSHFNMFQNVSEPEHMAFLRSMITREALVSLRLAGSA